MKPLDETNKKTKQRHGFVTAWLILMIIGNSSTALFYLFAGDIMALNFPNGISLSMRILYAVLSIANVIFSAILFNWKKIGFWGYTLIAIVVSITNVTIGVEIMQSVFGLAGIAILYGVLQIKKDNITAWSNLD